MSIKIFIKTKSRAMDNCEFFQPMDKILMKLLQKSTLFLADTLTGHLLKSDTVFKFRQKQCDR